MMMRHHARVAGLGLVFALALAGGPIQAAVTFGSAKLTADAYAPVASEQQDVKTIASLPTADVSADVLSLSDNYANASGSAGFTDETSGFITFKDVSASATYSSQAKTASSYLNLDYTFTIDSSYILRLSYDLVGASDVSYSVFTGKNNTSYTVLPTGQGYVLTAAFGPGTYTLEISGEANADPTASNPSITENTKGGVGFLLLPNGRPTSDVPEPAIWALMVCGFGLVGSSMRRRGYRSAIESR